MPNVIDEADKLANQWDRDIHGALDIALQKRDPTRTKSPHDYATPRTPEEQALVSLWLQRKKIEDEKRAAAYKEEVLRAAKILRQQLRQLGEEPCA